MNRPPIAIMSCRQQSITHERVHSWERREMPRRMLHLPLGSDKDSNDSSSQAYAGTLEQRSCLYNTLANIPTIVFAGSGGMTLSPRELAAPKAESDLPTAERFTLDNMLLRFGPLALLGAYRIILGRSMRHIPDKGIDRDLMLDRMGEFEADTGCPMGAEAMAYNVVNRRNVPDWDAMKRAGMTIIVADALFDRFVRDGLTPELPQVPSDCEVVVWLRQGDKLHGFDRELGDMPKAERQQIFRALHLRGYTLATTYAGWDAEMLEVAG